MNRIWYIYWALVISAIWDFSLTVWNLSVLGFGFEGNPFIRNWWIAALVKIAVCLLAVLWFRKYEKRTLFDKFAFMGGMLMLIVGQLYGGYTHIPFLINQHESTDTVLADGNVTFTINDEQVSYSMPVSMLERAKWYMAVLGVLFIYPYLFHLLSVWLVLWVEKKGLKTLKKDESNVKDKFV